MEVKTAMERAQICLEKSEKNCDKDRMNMANKMINAFINIDDAIDLIKMEQNKKIKDEYYSILKQYFDEIVGDMEWTLDF